MHRLLLTSIDAAVAGLIMAPVFYILNRIVFHSKRRTVFYFLFAVYLSGVFAVVGLPDIRYIRLNLHTNFIPFAYMFSDYKSTILNVILFFPMGFFLPFLWKNFHVLWKTLFFGFSASLLIELLQIFTLRATDVNDLITNTFGTLTGWITFRIFLRLNPNDFSENCSYDALYVCGASFLTMFFIHPLVSELLLMAL